MKRRRVEWEVKAIGWAEFVYREISLGGGTIEKGVGAGVQYLEFTYKMGLDLSFYLATDGAVSGSSQHPNTLFQSLTCSLYIHLPI